MPQVVVVARNPVIPARCACCGAPPEIPVSAFCTQEKGVKVVKVSTREIRYGLCRFCVAHLNNQPSSLGGCLKWAAVLAAVALSVAAPPLLVIFVPIAAWWLWKAVRRPKEPVHEGPQRGPGCQSTSRPFVLESWSGDELHLYFDSPNYAADFAQAQHDAGHAVLRVWLYGGPVVQPAAGPEGATPMGVRIEGFDPSTGQHDLDLPWNQQPKKRRRR